MTTPHPLVSRRPPGPLQGRVAVPGDKSISHRALMFAALAVGETRIDGLLEGEDVLCTAAAMRALGADVQQGGGAWRVAGRGVGGLAEPDNVLDMGNSGTAARLLAGMLASHDLYAVMTGDASLRRRPMRRVTEPLALCGARFTTREGGRLPLSVQGAADAMPIHYRLPVASAQVKSAILLAGLNARGQTVVEEPVATRDHSENMLRHFGADVSVLANGAERMIVLQGQPELRARDVVVPGDPSSAAFPLVAALLVPGSVVTALGVGLNPAAHRAARDLAGDGGRSRGHQRTHRGRRAGRRHHGAVRSLAGGGCAAGAGAQHDRRIPHPGRRRRFRRGHDADARPRRVAGQRKRPPASHRGHAGSSRCARDHRWRRFAGRGQRPGRRGLHGADPYGPPPGHERPGAGPRHRRTGRRGRCRLHRDELPKVRGVDDRVGGRHLVIIAIDGPAAAGKGTLARRLAAELGLPYLDTGLLYRAVGRRVLDAGADPADPVAAEQQARALQPEDLARPDLRGPAADQAASQVASIPGVRAALLAFQRGFATRGGAVLDGRDIGTVIFPDAAVEAVRDRQRGRSRRTPLEGAASPGRCELAGRGARRPDHPRRVGPGPAPPPRSVRRRARPCSTRRR